VYRVTSRGDRRDSIFADDEDRAALLAIAEQGLARFDTQRPPLCLMATFPTSCWLRAQRHYLVVDAANQCHLQPALQPAAWLGRYLLEAHFKAIQLDHVPTFWRPASGRLKAPCPA
jgi:hypothetical protein